MTAALIIFVFFIIIIAAISFEAAFRSKSKENFSNGIKDNAEKKHSTSDIEEL